MTPGLTDETMLLEVRELRTHLHLEEGILKAVDGIHFSLKRGHTLGIVGESGCGKSVASLSLLRLLPPFAQLEGDILLRLSKGERKGEIINIAKLHPRDKLFRQIRGGEIAMIFQEPMKAFSPVHTIGSQIMEAIRLHRKMDKKQAREFALQLLHSVRIANPAQRLNEYPHQLSGGMRQRAMIAMALSGHPSVLIADEPTTALDVTIQAQVLQLIDDLKASSGMSVIFITHDLGVIAEMADDVAVMYMGMLVEYTTVEKLFHQPAHPYTIALMKAMPSMNNRGERLASIEGTVPIPINRKPGCPFFSRCPVAVPGWCDKADVHLTRIASDHWVRCVFHQPHDQGGAR
jgi:peptide/nickel transport system ATP-binding protein